MRRRDLKLTGEVFRAKVRGIYTTALTKILLDNGFKIVQPSKTIKERFNLPETIGEEQQPDAEIFDRLDKQGVNIVGKAAAVNRIASILLDLLDDVIVRRQISIFSGLQLSNRENMQRGLNENLCEVIRDIETVSPDMRIRIDVEFPFLSKKKLDEIRGAVVPTLNGHHYYKACGGKIASMLEMAEKLIENGYPLREAEEIFKECLLREYPYESSRISVEHVKIDGRILNLGEARIVEFNETENHMKLVRVFSSRGVYDGLNVPKEPGDYAVTTLKVGDWFIRTSYFSRDGEYKGTYVNISTPIELYPAKIRYVDLEADICMWPDGRTQKIDFENLDRFVQLGYISERLREIVYEKAKELMDSLRIDLEAETKIIDKGIVNRFRAS
ncbi:MAG: DUF402 domain-containing protein [Candidatus Bathyarchaeia archaeon]|nr:DUF402 domain-containing protein [Candidatus Bathyarchaeota archaeon]